MRLHRVITENRKALTVDQTIMNRYQELTRRISELSQGGRRMQMRRMGAHATGGFYVITPGGADAETDTDAGPSGFSAGPLQQLRRPVQRLLKFKWLGTSLVIDRDHWDDVFAGKSMSSVAEDVQKTVEGTGRSVARKPIFCDASRQQTIRALAYYFKIFTIERGRSGAPAAGIRGAVAEIRCDIDSKPTSSRQACALPAKDWSLS